MHRPWMLGWSGLLLVVACTATEGETTDPQAAVAGEPASIEAVAASEAPGGAARLPGEATASQVGEAGFPHGEHTPVGCRTCHTAPAGHAAHAALACGECHEFPPGAAVSNESPPASARCAGCHHASAQADCLRCHEGAPTDSRRTAASAEGVDSVPAGARRLPFEHARHAGTACATCHTDGPLLGAGASCAGCHDRHHTPSSTCAACHQTPAGTVAAHADAGVHLGCAGAGCHTDAAVLALPGTRNVCLACHGDMREHEPAGECQACHLTRIGTGGGG